MTETEIRSGLAQVLRKIAPEADLNAVSNDADMRETLDIDSFDYLRFLSGVHERFGIDIPESDYGKVRSLGALLSYLGERVKDNPV